MGFSYYFVGDYTFFILVGNEIVVTNTPAGVNDGIHTLTAVDYDGVNTRVQWAGMVTELGTPYGDLQVPADGWYQAGNADTHFGIQNYFGFEYITMFQRYAPSSFSEFYSFFGYTYIWTTEVDNVDPLDNRSGGFTVHNNSSGPGTVSLGDNDSFPTSASVSRVFFGVNMPNILAAGAKWITARIRESITSRRFVINHEHSNGSKQGAPFETVIDSIYPTARRTVMLPDADINFDTAISETLNFPGVASGEVLTMTFTNGILTARTLVP